MRRIRVTSAIRKALMQALATQFHDPRLKGIAILDVDLAPDFSQANVYFYLSEQADVDEAMAKRLLTRCVPRLRHYLTQHLALRHVPRLYFLFDPRVAEQRTLHSVLDALADDQDNKGDKAHDVSAGSSDDMSDAQDG